MSEGAPSGLFASLRRLIASALELAQVRLELIGNELEEQKLRILGAAVLAATGVMLVGAGLLLAAGFVVALFWDGYRLHALGVLTLLFLAGGAIVMKLAVHKLKTPSGMFAASVAELAQDRAALAPREDASSKAP